MRYLVIVTASIQIDAPDKDEAVESAMKTIENSPDFSSLDSASIKDG